MTGMLKVFSIVLYALLDPGATLSVVTPLVAKKFDILLDILNESFMVTNQVGALDVTKRVYRNCPIMLPNRVTHVELVELYMVDFDFWYGLVACLFHLHCCRTCVVKFNIPNEPVLEWRGKILFLEVVSFSV